MNGSNDFPPKLKERLDTLIVEALAEVASNQNSHMKELDLRAVLKFPDRMQYDASLKRLAPVYVTIFKDDDRVLRITLQGLLAVKSAATKRVLEAARVFLSRRFAHQPDFPSFSLTEVMTSGGLLPPEKGFAYNVIDLAGIHNYGEPFDGSFRWEKPKDIEALTRHEDIDGFIQYVTDKTNRTSQKSTATTAASPKDLREHAPKHALIMNGGGVKGLAFVGALKELHNRVDICFDKYAGTSAGAIGAAILSMGYGTDALEKIMLGHSFSAFLNSKWEPSWEEKPWTVSSHESKKGLARMVFQSAFQLILFPIKVLIMIAAAVRGKLYTSVPVGLFIRYLAQWRPYQTGPLVGQSRIARDQQIGMKLRELSSIPMIVASSTGPESVHVFHDDDNIEFAVRSSMAIPGVFERQTDGISVLYDGGMVANFALRQFLERHPSHQTIGMYLYDGSERPSPIDGGLSIFGLLWQVLRIWMGQDEVAIVQKHADGIIKINTSPIQTLDFDLSADDKKLLILSGKLAVIRFLLETKHGLSLKPGCAPTVEEFEHTNHEWTALRKIVKKRMIWPHFVRRVKVLTVLGMVLAAIGLLLTAVGSLIATCECPSSSDTQGHLPAEPELKRSVPLDGNETSQQPPSSQPLPSQGSPSSQQASSQQPSSQQPPPSNEGAQALRFIPEEADIVVGLDVERLMKNKKFADIISKYLIPIYSAKIKSTIEQCHLSASNDTLHAFYVGIDRADNFAFVIRSKDSLGDASKILCIIAGATGARRSLNIRNRNNRRVLISNDLTASIIDDGTAVITNSLWNKKIDDLIDNRGASVLSGPRSEVLAMLTEKSEIWADGGLPRQFRSFFLDAPSVTMSLTLGRDAHAHTKINFESQQDPALRQKQGAKLLEEFSERNILIPPAKRINIKSDETSITFDTNFTLAEVTRVQQNLAINNSDCVSKFGCYWLWANCDGEWSYAWDTGTGTCTKI